MEGDEGTGRRLRPVDLGRAIGLTAEMARRYERWGCLPRAERSATGRRLYGPRHLHAILAAPEMRAGFGSKAALGAMHRLHQGDLAGALALVDERHAALHRRRLEVEETLRLQTVAVLRRAGYRFDSIAAVLDELAGGRPSTALTAIQRRREELTRASERCSRATAAFWSYAAAVCGRPAPLTDTVRGDPAPRARREQVPGS